MRPSRAPRQWDRRWQITVSPTLRCWIRTRQGVSNHSSEQQPRRRRSKRWQRRSRRKRAMLFTGSVLIFALAIRLRVAGGSGVEVTSSGRAPAYAPTITERGGRGGWGAKRIAREFEVARNTVRRSLRLRTVEAGIQIRPRARTRTEGCIRFGTVSPGGDDRHVCLDYEIPILGQRSFLPQDLAGECLVVLEPHTLLAVVGDGDAVARGLRELDAVPDDGIEVAPGEVMADVVGHRLREGRPA